MQNTNKVLTFIHQKYLFIFFLITAIEGLIIANIVLITSTNTALVKNLNTLLVIGTLGISGLLLYFAFFSLINKELNKSIVDKLKYYSKNDHRFFYAWAVILTLDLIILVFPLSLQVYKLFYKRLFPHLIWLILILLQILPLLNFRLIAERVWNTFINRTLDLYKFLDNIFDKYSLLIPVLIVSVIFFHPQTILLTNDSGWYVARAINLFEGRGYIDSNWMPDTYRGPVFPGIIALYFRLFGISFISAYWVVRTFFIGNLVLCYLLGRELFNKTWGFFIFLFILTSPELYNNSYSIMLDMIMPFFILLAFYWIVWALKTEHWYFFMLSGVSFAVAYLTKATAGVFFAAPILLMFFYPLARRKRLIKYWIVLYIGLGMILLPWFGYLDFSGKNPFYEIDLGIKLILNPARQQPGIDYAGKNTYFGLINYPIKFIKLFLQYYHLDFSKHLILAPIFIITWVITGIKLYLKKGVRYPLIISGGLLFLLLAPLQARMNFGTRHSLILYYFSYFAIASAFFPSDNGYISDEGKNQKNFGVFTALLTILLVFQVFVGEYSLVNAAGSAPPAFLPKEYSFEGADHGYVAGKKISSWFNDHLIEEPNLMVDYRFGNFVYCFNMDKKPLTDYPFVDSKNLNEAGTQDDWIAVWNYLGWHNLSQERSQLVAVSENDLLEEVQKNQIDFVIIAIRSYPLLYYLYNHPDFALIYGPDEFGNYIFEVAEEVRPISTLPNPLFNFLVGKGTIQFLNEMKNEKPEEYSNLKNAYLHGVMQLDDEQIDDIENAEYPIFDETISMTHLDYIKRIKTLYGHQGVLRAIQVQEEKLTWAKNQTGTKRLLVSLYLYSGDYYKALHYIEELKTELPADVFLHNLLLLTRYAIENNSSPDEIINLYNEYLEPDLYSIIDDNVFINSIVQ